MAMATATAMASRSKNLGQSILLEPSIVPKQHTKNQKIQQHVEELKLE